jgi:hypothetical protein
MAGMAIAHFPSIVIDCPDPGALARFYGAMLDWKVDVSSDWAEVEPEGLSAGEANRYSRSISQYRPVVVATMNHSDWRTA